MPFTRLHLIERLGLDEPWDGEPGYTKTGYWAFTKELAESFVGCFLFLHEGQLAPARYAGEIVDVFLQTEGKYAGRVVFKVKDEPRLIGVITSMDGWDRWWKADGWRSE